jgi:hypothetical protein
VQRCTTSTTTITAAASAAGFTRGGLRAVACPAATVTRFQIDLVPRGFQNVYTCVSTIVGSDRASARTPAVCDVSEHHMLSVALHMGTVAICKAGPQDTCTPIATDRHCVQE